MSVGLEWWCFNNRTVKERWGVSIANQPAKQTMIDTPRWGGHGPPPLPPVPAGIPDSDYNTLLLAIWVTAVVTQHNRSLIEQRTQRDFRLRTGPIYQ